MEKEIIVAIIGAAAAVTAALIGLFGKNKATNRRNTEVHQTASGDNITQIGIQQNHSSAKEGEKHA